MAAWFELVPRHRPKRSKAVARSLADVAQHDLRRTGRARWACRCCGVVADDTAAWRALRHRACAGPIAMRAASSHAIFGVAGSPVVGCWRCGAWATRKPRCLLQQCRGRPCSVATAQALLRWRKGLHPLARFRDAVAARRAARPVALDAAFRGAADPDSLVAVAQDVVPPPSHEFGATLAARGADCDARFEALRVRIRARVVAGAASW